MPGAVPAAPVQPVTQEGPRLPRLWGGHARHSGRDRHLPVRAGELPHHARAGEAGVVPRDVPDLRVRQELVRQRPRARQPRDRSRTNQNQTVDHASIGLIVTRRDFHRSSAAVVMPPALGAAFGRGEQSHRFKIGLNQWSPFNGYVGDTSAPDWWEMFAKLLVSDPSQVLRGTLDPMNFPRLTRESYGLDAI